MKISPGAEGLLGSGTGSEGSSVKPRVRSLSAILWMADLGRVSESTAEQRRRKREGFGGWEMSVGWRWEGKKVKGGGDWSGRGLRVKEECVCNISWNCEKMESGEWKRIRSSGFR